MEEMMCWSCKRSRTGLNPKNIEEIDNSCELPSILRALGLDENRLYCPHYSMNEKVCNSGYENTLGEDKKSVKDGYLEGKCPDCFDPIPDDIVEGDKCPNCGHVFHHLEEENLKRIEEKGEKMDNDLDLRVVCESDVSIDKFSLMFDPIEYAVEKTSEGYNVRYIAIDNEPESPRQCDNFGTMVCFHRRYSLGDDEHGYRGERFDSWDGLRDEIERNEDPGVILPLYLYDHSGITMKTHPFNDRWDSGQVGFIFVSKDKIREEFSIEDKSVDITDGIIDGAKKLLESEVVLYDYYLTGDVYRLVKEKFDKDKQQIDHDIVCGYYGLESAREELKTF